MLLLDEPNNYLDITSIRWLEKFLIAWPGELMLITHDRSFMDKVVTHTMAIHRRKVRKIEGDTGKLYAQIALDEETYEKTRINDERRRKEIENFIAKFRASARLQGLVESRKKTLAKMGRKDKLEIHPVARFRLRLQDVPREVCPQCRGPDLRLRPGRAVDQGLRPLSIGSPRPGLHRRPERPGQDDASQAPGRPARAPGRDSVISPIAVTAGYFEQTNVQSLVPAEHRPGRDPDRRLSRSSRRQARFLAGMMMFEGDDALKKIAVLSGGEKSRVLLAKLIATPVNLLLLDEPTNHLDMESSDALLEALD